MRPGVVGLMPPDPLAVDAAAARRVRAAGFTGVSLVVRGGEPSRGQLARARDVLAGEGVRVAQLNTEYESLVSPDEARRREGVRVVRASCRWARWLAAGNTYVRPGSLSPAGPWAPHPGNARPEAVERLVRSLREAAPAAEEEGVYLALEGHVTSTLNGVERIREVIEAVGSPALRLNVDPVNLVGSIAEAYESAAFLDRYFAALGRYAVAAHVKDYLVEERHVVHISECPPGEGVLDLETFLRRFEAACPDGYALIEHLPDDRIPGAKAALDAALTRAGLAWRA